DARYKYTDSTIDVKQNLFGQNLLGNLQGIFAQPSAEAIPRESIPLTSRIFSTAEFAVGIRSSSQSLIGATQVVMGLLGVGSKLYCSLQDTSRVFRVPLIQ